MVSKYRILSLDGGGLRGVITSILLQRLNEEAGIENWLTKADLIAGTSTGGIIALGLANGNSPEELGNLYIKKGPRIFDDSIWDNIVDVGKLIGAQYSNRALKSELRVFFKNITLGDLEKKVTIPTFDLDNGKKRDRSWKPKIFHNYSGPDSDSDWLAHKVALYTSSAPTYFPSADGYIDGGVFANNPSLVAICQAISRHNIPSERAELSELVLLSVGTGVTLSHIKGKNLDWGGFQWIKPLVNILMDGVAGISDYQAHQLLDKRYHRLQIVFDKGESIPMDSVKKIGRMQQIANDFKINHTVKWIKDYWL